MYAIVETGGKQYRVTEGDTCQVELLPDAVGSDVILERVLVVGNGEGIEVGNPCVVGACVRAKVKAHGKGRKIIVYKYKAKKNYRLKKGHRQPYTELFIEKIETGKA